MFLTKNYCFVWKAVSRFIDFRI